MAIRNFLAALKLFLNAKSSLSLWSKWQIGHRKWFLNINLFLIKPFQAFHKNSVFFTVTICKVYKKNVDNRFSNLFWFLPSNILSKYFLVRTLPLSLVYNITLCFLRSGGWFFHSHAKFWPVSEPVQRELNRWSKFWIFRCPLKA